MTGFDFPNAAALVRALLDDVDNGPKMPRIVADKVPYRVISRIGGAAIDPRFLDGPLVHVISLAADEDTAIALARTAGHRLWLAWRSQTVPEGGLGHIQKVAETVGPTPYIGVVPDGVSRVDATYRLNVRP